MLYLHIWIFGPALGSYVSRPVRLSVSQSVRDKSSHTSRHYFFLIFCNKLACSKCRKVTKPDFAGKLSNFFYKQFWGFWGFWPFSRERCISFGWNFIFRYFSTLSTTFVLAITLPAPKIFLDTPSDGSYVFQHRPSVRNKSSYIFRHWVFMIFCKQLGCSKCKKKWRNPIFHKKLYAKKWGFWPFSRERFISYGWKFIYR